MRAPASVYLILVTRWFGRFHRQLLAGIATFEGEVKDMLICFY
jgi:hypothetical protein